MRALNTCRENSTTVLLRGHYCSVIVSRCSRGLLVLVLSLSVADVAAHGLGDLGVIVLAFSRSRFIHHNDRLTVNIRHLGGVLLVRPLLFD